MLRRSRKIYVICPAFDYLSCGTETFADAFDELPISFGRYCENEREPCGIGCYFNYPLLRKG
jgi:hypothetical protein